MAMCTKTSCGSQLRQKELKDLHEDSNGHVEPRYPSYQCKCAIEILTCDFLCILSMATKQDEHNWDLHLPLVMLAYRTSLQESTGCTPFELVFGRDAWLPVDVMYGLPPQTSPTEANQNALDLRLRMEKAY